MSSPEGKEHPIYVSFAHCGQRSNGLDAASVRFLLSFDDDAADSVDRAFRSVIAMVKILKLQTQ